MASLTHYYQRAKGGIANINGKDLADLGEDYLITGATGAVLGLISASIGSLDKTVAGMPVPVDGAVSLGLGLAALSTRSRELRVASIAAGGSAAARTFEKFFKKAMGVHGEFDGGAFPQLSPQSGYNYGYGWGAESADPLLAAAQSL